MGTFESAVAAARAHTRRAIACPARLRSNPYLSLLYSHLAGHGLEVVEEPRITVGFLLRRRAEIGFVHYHFPDNLHRFARGPRVLQAPLSWAKLCLLAVRLATARMLGYRLVWTIHQILPHDTRTPRRDRLVARLLARACKILIVHDAATARTAAKHLGPAAAARLEIVPHGSYVGVYPPGRAREDVRRSLGLSSDAFVFLSFGMIRPYKGIEVLLEAFSGLPGDDVALVVAGKPGDEAMAAMVRAAAHSDLRVVPVLGLVPDEAVAELFGACDAAVLGRADGGTSGSLVLALSLGLPVVAADTPGYHELTKGFEAGWGFRPGSASSLRAALAEAAADREAARRRGTAAGAVAEGLRWDEIAARTADLLRDAGR